MSDRHSLASATLAVQRAAMRYGRNHHAVAARLLLVTQSRLLRCRRQLNTGSLTTLREKLIKVGAKFACHGRDLTFQMAEVAIPRALFANILRLIDGLRTAPLPP